MAPQTTRPVEADDADSTETRTRRLRRLLSPLQALSGVVLLVGAARAAPGDRRRAGLLALAGGGLLASWVRRQGPPTANDPESPATAGVEAPGDAEVSDEAAAHREQSKVLRGDETNPRGTSGEPDVVTETADDEGDVRFTEGGDEGAEPKPHLDADVEADPRVPDGEEAATDDDHVEVDLSESAMADEASEATGPDPEQAYPSREGTDPEPTSPEAPESGGEGAATNPGPMPDDGNSSAEADDTDEGGAGADRGESDDGAGSGEPEVVDDEDDASDVVEADDDVPAPDVDETDDRM